MGRFGGAQAGPVGWLRRADPTALVVAALAAGGLGAFLVVAAVVTASDPWGADARILRAMRDSGDPRVPAGPPWLPEAAADVTALGGPTVLTLLVGGVLGYLGLARRRHAAALVLVATAGGALLSTALKGLYARPRPDVVPHLAVVASHSFPSGHAMVSAVVYLTLGALLARLVGGRWAKGYFVGAAVLLTALIGASRVYLGVHYPTDVAAGWAAGTAWAAACWFTARHLQRRGLVERPGTGTLP
jgi:undecaprenyl-diphosphatase